MQFTANIDYAKLSKAFEKTPLAAARELRFTLNKDLRVIQVDAKLHHAWKRNLGGLERSILQDVDRSGLSGKVWIEKSVAPYGKFVHDGTKPHKIFPKNKPLLYYVSSKLGHLVGSKGVNHPGTKPDPFLYDALERQKPYFVQHIKEAVKRIFDSVGL